MRWNNRTIGIPDGVGLVLGGIALFVALLM